MESKETGGGSVGGKKDTAPGGVKIPGFSAMKRGFPVGTMVKPLASKKDKTSSWLRGFSGKKYSVSGYDSIDGKPLLVLDTSAGKPGETAKTDYELVYPSEVKKI